jgi:competence protein ComEC
MTAVILSFACGVMFLQLLPELPAAGWFALALSPLVCVSGRKFLCAVFLLPAAFALGFCWALACAHVRLSDRLAPELEGTDIEVVGVVSSLPAQGERSLRFEFEPESAAHKLPAKILLSWYRSPIEGGLRED